jgi:hypothetical protein
MNQTLRWAKHVPAVMTSTSARKKIIRAAPDVFREKYFVAAVYFRTEEDIRGPCSRFIRIESV